MTSQTKAPLTQEQETEYTQALAWQKAWKLNNSYDVLKPVVESDCFEALLTSLNEAIVGLGDDGRFSSHTNAILTGMNGLKTVVNMYVPVAIPDTTPATEDPSSGE